MIKKMFFILMALFILSLKFALSADEGMKIRSIDSILADIKNEQGVKGNDKINPDKVSPKLLEELGDAVMEKMIGNSDRHEFMDNMMGGEGSASLTAMHQRIGYNYLTGNTGGYGGNGGMMGYGGMMGGYPYNNNMYKNQYNGSSDNGFMMNRLNGYLNLTKEQNDMIQNINIDLEKKISPLRVKILEKRKVLNNLLSVENIDEKAIMKADKELFDISFSINNEYLKAQITILKILTAEQRKKLPNLWITGGFPMMYYMDN